MTFVPRVFMLLFVALAGGPLLAEESAKANDSSAPGRIVILGDSITAGYGLDRSLAYPALLQKEIDAAGLSYTVVNAGVSGDTTAGGLRRVDWALAQPADILIVALGGNDGLRGIPPARTADNLAAIIHKAKAKHPAVRIVIAGMQMPDNMGRDFVESFRAIFSKVASENDAALVPFLLEGVGGVASLNQPDRIHPTAEGQKLVAANVWSVLKELLDP